MIPAQSTMVQTNELPGEEFEFGIGDVRWAMRNNADMYSNVELAVIREYSTNAFDANKEKSLLEGTEVQPIEVTLPNSLSNSELSIKDHGYGMDKETLVKVYTQFGLSTKRDSNNYNGMLGYGSKSAVAYTTQFSVTSVSKGRKIVAVITRRPDWSIGMKIVFDEVSDEPTGTTVKVPVHNVPEFNKKAEDFYRFWLPGTVKVNGREVEHFAGEKVIDGLYRSANYGSYIVMGNVPYRLENPEALFRNQPINQFNFVAYVDTGDVEFVPNREALKYTDLTKRTLHSMIADFGKRLVETAKAEINASQNHAEAYEVWTKWAGIVSRTSIGELSFKGDTPSTYFDVNGFSYSYGLSGRTVRNWRIDYAPKTVFVLDFPGSPSSSQKAKVREWKQFRGLGNDGYILFVTSSKIDCIWLDHSKMNFITWEKLKEETPKKPRVSQTSNRTARKTGTFDAYTKDGFRSEIEVPSDLTKVFHVSSQEAREYSISGMIRSLPVANQNVTVMVVPANRAGKFGRDFSEVKDFRPWAKSFIIKDGGSLVSEDYKKWYSMDWDQRRTLSYLDASTIDDPEIREFIRVSKYGSAPKNPEYERNHALARNFGMGAEVSFSQDGGNWNGLKEKYPLVSYSDARHHRQDVILYMNTKYQADLKSARKDEDE